MNDPQPHNLREYALVADGQRGALVGPRGDFAWLCFPGWDDPAVFAELLGGRGAYAVRPDGRFVWGGYYEPGTLIWRNRWTTVDDAVIECRDALAFPGDRDRLVLLRRVQVINGEATIEVALDPRADFGVEPARDLRREQAGGWSGRTRDIHFLWLGGDDAEPGNPRDEPMLCMKLRLRAGDQHDLVLVLAQDSSRLERLSADRCWSATEESWRTRVPQRVDALGARDARHACAVLAGLTSDSGGTVAACTTSLPERATARRNYDYRYVWIRDQCFAGQSAAAVGSESLLEGSIRFVRERLLEDGASLKPAYTTSGGSVPGESELPLSGYPGGRAVVGNNAAEQFQLDAFGEALLLFATLGADRLSAQDWRAVEIASAAIEQRWREPDCGVWELDREEWTHSRLIAAAGLRAVATCAAAQEQRASWISLADTITADVSRRCLHPDGRWRRSPVHDGLDVSLLLPPLRGAVPADDPRTVATLTAVIRELAEDHFAYRFRHDQRPLGEAEGAFLLCGFIVSLAKLQQGDVVDAARWFERNRAACGPPGLLSEEFDIQQRQLRGNLPQSFVHALMLECAVRLASAA